MMLTMLGGGLWMMCFLNGCNNFILSSAVVEWYFEEGHAFGDYAWRLVRFHAGSVALASMLNGVLFVIKVVSAILAFETKREDGNMLSSCLKLLNSFLFVFTM